MFYIIIPIILFLTGSILRVITNYNSYDIHSCKKAIATVEYKQYTPPSRYRRGGHKITLRFNNGHRAKIINEDLYHKANIGDKVSLIIYDGRWGIPVIQERDFNRIKIHSNDSVNDSANVIVK